jgi:hypothetical protein
VAAVSCYWKNAIKTISVHDSHGETDETDDTHNLPDASSFDGMCLLSTTGVNFKAVKINLLKTAT